MEKKSTLEIYLEKQAEFKSQIKANSLPLESIVAVQELNYRIDALETCKALIKTAPVTTELKVLGYHYQLLNNVICALLTEHKIGVRPDEERKKSREAAHSSLERVVQNWRKRFYNYNAETQEQYAKDLGDFISAVMSVWIAYRNMYVNI